MRPLLLSNPLYWAPPSSECKALQVVSPLIKNRLSGPCNSIRERDERLDIPLYNKEKGVANNLDKYL